MSSESDLTEEELMSLKPVLIKAIQFCSESSQFRDVKARIFNLLSIIQEMEMTGKLNGLEMRYFLEESRKILQRFYIPVNIAQTLSNDMNNVTKKPHDYDDDGLLDDGGNYNCFSGSRKYEKYCKEFSNSGLQTNPINYQFSLRRATTTPLCAPTATFIANWLGYGSEYVNDYITSSSIVSPRKGSLCNTSEGILCHDKYGGALTSLEQPTPHTGPKQPQKLVPNIEQVSEQLKSKMDVILIQGCNTAFDVSRNDIRLSYNNVSNENVTSAQNSEYEMAIVPYERSSNQSQPSIKPSHEQQVNKDSQQQQQLVSHCNVLQQHQQFFQCDQHQVYGENQQQHQVYEINQQQQVYQGGQHQVYEINQQQQVYQGGQHQVHETNQQQQVYQGGQHQVYEINQQQQVYHGEESQVYETNQQQQVYQGEEPQVYETNQQQQANQGGQHQVYEINQQQQVCHGDEPQVYEINQEQQVYQDDHWQQQFYQGDEPQVYEVNQQQQQFYQGDEPQVYEVNQQHQQFYQGDEPQVYEVNQQHQQVYHSNEPQVNEINQQQKFCQEDQWQHQFYNANMGQPQLYNGNLWKPQLHNGYQWQPQFYNVNLWKPQIHNENQWQQQLHNGNLWKPQLHNGNQWQPQFYNINLWKPQIHNENQWQQQLYNGNQWQQQQVYGETHQQQEHYRGNHCQYPQLLICMLQEGNQVQYPQWFNGKYPQHDQLPHPVYQGFQATYPHALNKLRLHEVLGTKSRIPGRNRKDMYLCQK